MTRHLGLVVNEMDLLPATIFVAFDEEVNAFATTLVDGLPVVIGSTDPRHAGFPEVTDGAWELLTLPYEDIADHCARHGAVATGLVVLGHPIPTMRFWR